MSSAQEQSGSTISTVAGTGAEGSGGDRKAAVSAALNRPYGIAVDGTGTLHVSEQGGHRLRRIATDGRIGTVAGTGTPGSRGDGGPAASAELSGPRAIAVDSAGTLYVADAQNHRVRRITADGRITTVAGTGAPGTRGDGGPAASAELDNPLGVAVDGAGVLYVSEYGSHRVRRIATDGIISTIAGTGTAGFDGDGGPADQARLNRPYGVVADSTGALYLADAENHRIRRIAADGIISTIAGTGTAGFEGDGGPATDAQLNFPMELVLDSTGALHFSDFHNHRVRRIATDGTISTVAGTDTGGFEGDGGPADQAQLNHPAGLAMDRADTLYIADRFNNRIRRIPSTTTAALPESGAVVAWANVRSRLRMGVQRESYQDGAEIHQAPTTRRDHQRWRLVVAGRHNGDVLYTIENVRSGKVLEVPEALAVQGTVVAQRAPEGADARHQQWRLIPMGSPGVYEIANRSSGLLLQVDVSTPAAIKQHRADGDHRNRQWQLLPA
ncbi:NHL domain-containing protein [Kitasatospora griseola]|uniref:NHL domain-containing protein n=1 Tax=Kitasatospora griseola TaxID=2064 RepID=UPI00382DEA65